MSYSFAAKTISDTPRREVMICELANVGVTFGSGSEGIDILTAVNGR